jgi:phosphatidylethanolamine-binding protein (PEBP) family uncharacterized protein
MLQPLLGLAVAMSMVACASGDGRTLRPPTEPAPTTAPPDVGAGVLDGDISIEEGSVITGLAVDPDLDTIAPANAMELFTPWIQDGTIDERYGCDGLGISPLLAWSQPPPGTVEMALVVNDVTGTDPISAGPLDDPLQIVSPVSPDDPIHWLVIGIDPATSAIPEGAIPAGARPIVNSFGESGWTAPCPDDDTSSDLRFTLIALAQPLPDLDDLVIETVIDLISSSTIASAVGEGTYQR